MTAKKLSRRNFLKTASLAIGSSAVLAACAPAGAPTASDSSGDTMDEPAMDEVTLTFGMTWGAAFQGRQIEFNEQFTERHPNIQTDVTFNTWGDHNKVVPTWAAGGELPDIIYVHGSRAFPWAFEGMFISLDEFIDASPEFDIDGVWEEALRLYRQNGIQYGIPYDHGPLILGYNKDLFDAAGMDYPTAEWTMDDLRETAIALTDTEAAVPQWGWRGNLPQLGNTGYGLTVGPWGGEMWNEDETELLLNNDTSIAAIQWWTDLIHADGAAPTPADSEAFEGGAWMAGRIAMSSVASWNTPSLAEFAPFSWDVAPWPKGPDGRRETNSFGSGFSITTNSAHPNEGWVYMSEYLNKEGMEFMWGSTGRGSPAREAAYDSWINSEPAPENAEYFLEALSNYAITGSPFQTLAAAEANDIHSREMGLVRSGDKPVAEAVAAIVDETNPVLAEAAERFKAGSS
ncbi:MAG: extracellular solute-binding protein [Chloroflexota bacterium]